MITDDDPDGDWTAPGVYRCAPGVHRIPLPLPDDGLRAVNVYALPDGEGWTLIDSGWALAQSRDLLAAALDELGAGLGDVRRFLVTHVHRDHYTQAVVLRREFGAQVALGRGEQPALAEIMDERQDPFRAHSDRLRRAGSAELVTLIEAHRPDPGDRDEWAEPDTWLGDGEKIEVGDGVLTTVATPGHTRGHVVFADDGRTDGTGGLLYAGDHVLPRITPSIGFEAAPPPRPLADFLTSLQLVRARPDALLLPAHGPVGMRVHERVDALLAHHDQRLAATLAAVGEGRTTANEVAGGLTWTRRERRLPEMDPFNSMLAVLETQAHLDLLGDRGAVAVTRHDGIDHYTTS